jgi:hypothetical protein
MESWGHGSYTKDEENNIVGIERLDQGHLYPNVEVPGLTCPGRESILGLPRGKQAL